MLITMSLGGWSGSLVRSPAPRLHVEVPSRETLTPEWLLGCFKDPTAPQCYRRVHRGQMSRNIKA